MSLLSAWNSIATLGGTPGESADVKIDRELRAGLPNEQERLTRCRMVQDFYDLLGIKYVPKRDAESMTDYQSRPKRTLPFCRRVVDILCGQLYNPGPARKIEDPSADEWYQGVCRDNLVNVLMQRADKLATLQGIAAVQVAATGDEARPIKFQLWGEEQLALYPADEDATRIAHVVTVEEWDQQRTMTWYTAETIRVYRTKKLTRGQTAGGRTAEQVSDEPNPYGVLPFAFVHHDLPTNGYMTHGIGDYLATLNNTLDIEASDLLEAVAKYHRPWGFVYDAAADWQPIHKMGGFIRLNSNPTDLERANPPRVEFVQPELDVAGGWENIRQAIDTALEGLGVPTTMYRMNQSTLPSGAAMVAEQQPLIDYSRARQVPFVRYETDLATVACRVGGAYYGRVDLLAAAEDLKLSATWPPTTIRTPGAEQDQQDANSVQMGLESTAMVTKRRFGLNSDEEVWEHLEQVAEDEQRLAGIRYQPEMEDSTDGVQAEGAQGSETPEAQGQMSEDDDADAESGQEA